MNKVKLYLKLYKKIKKKNVIIIGLYMINGDQSFHDINSKC